MGGEEGGKAGEDRREGVEEKGRGEMSPYGHL